MSESAAGGRRTEYSGDVTMPDPMEQLRRREPFFWRNPDCGCGESSAGFSLRDMLDAAGGPDGGAAELHYFHSVKFVSLSVCKYIKNILKFRFGQGTGRFSREGWRPVPSGIPSRQTGQCGRPETDGRYRWGKDTFLPIARQTNPEVFPCIAIA